ncbi:co-chaperone GroES, partial [Clostridiaceae bacterium HSG29]|nr:co-chaperone GroES [Clostridiaceae bacterium HSG29]
VVLKKIENQNKTQSGIILTEKNNEEDNFAEIVAVGDKIENNEIIIGKTVIYKKYSETVVKIENEEIFIVDEDDLLGIIEKGE